MRLELTAGHTPGAFWGLRGRLSGPRFRTIRRKKVTHGKSDDDTVDANDGIVSNAHSETFAKQIFNNLLVPCMFLNLRC